MKQHRMHFISITLLVAMLLPVVGSGQRQNTRKQSAGKPATVKDITPRSTRRRPQSSARTSVGVNTVAGLDQTTDRPPARSIEPQYVDGQVLIQLRPNLSNAVASATKNAFQTKAGVLTATEIDTRAAAPEQEGQLYLASLAADKTVEDAIAALNQMSGVEFAEPNWIYTKAVPTSNDPLYANGSLWGMYSDDAANPLGPNDPIGITTNMFGIQAEKAWAVGHTGSADVYVAILDEGIETTHSDLQDNIWTNPGETGTDNAGRDKATNGIDDDSDGYVDDVHGFDFFSDDGSVYDGQQNDDPATPINEAEIDSHGTHVAGTIGALGGNGVGVAGVNWHVKMISGKFLGPVSGSTDKAVKAIDYFIMLKRQKGLNVVAINASWGGGGYSRALHNALKRAAAANILFVAAAGNGDRFGIGINIDQRPYYPACYDTTQPTEPVDGQAQEPGASFDNVITVAAIDSAGNIAPFSNFGQVNVDLGAPGVRVLSTFPRGTYEFENGTSMATPHVTGAVALYASTNPSQAAATIKQAVLEEARRTPTSSMTNRTVSGGRLNVAAF